MERTGKPARYVGPVAKFYAKIGTATPLEDLRGPGRLWRFQATDEQAIQCPESDLDFLRTRPTRGRPQ